MKLLNKDKIYGFIPKINVLLSFSAVVLVVLLVFNLRKPYEAYSLNGNRLKMQQFESVAKHLSAILQATPGFKEEIFKRSQLFNLSAKNNQPGQEKKLFVLLGVSLGDKRIAVIKDTKENKNYYCKEGDSIGYFTVKQILMDKVVLESDGNLLEINK